MIEGWRRHGLSVRPVTCDAAWLDCAATRLKVWFAQRQIRIPAHAGFLEELEGLEAEELRRHHWIRFTSTGANHDDACVALCLSAERVAGGRRPEASAIGKPKLPEIQSCRASEVAGGSVPCPIAGGEASLLPGCLTCGMVQHLVPLHEAHLATGAPWVSLPAFAGRFEPNAFVRAQRFAAAGARWGF